MFVIYDLFLSTNYLVLFLMPKHIRAIGPSNPIMGFRHCIIVNAQS
jgi:hypothetical protein